MQKIPGKQVVSFIQKTPGEWLINKYGFLNEKVSTIIAAVPKGEFHTWTKNGVILMSAGNEIYFAKPGRKWQKLKIPKRIPLENITRIALNEQNTKLAVVIAE